MFELDQARHGLALNGLADCALQRVRLEKMAPTGTSLSNDAVSFPRLDEDGVLGETVASLP